VYTSESEGLVTFEYSSNRMSEKKKLMNAWKISNEGRVVDGNC